MAFDFQTRIPIGHHLIGPGCPPMVIAEAGVNHNGSARTARVMCAAAAAAAADAIKFQTFKARSVASVQAPKAPYQLVTTDPAQSQQAMLADLELDEATHVQLMDQCMDLGITFLSTPYDEDSLDMLDRLGVVAFKISSSEITNHRLIARAAGKGKPLILSTGMSSIEEVEAAVSVVEEAGCRQLALMHCVTDYPADPAEANLRAMRTLADRFGVPVGFSDHTRGCEIAHAAVALGADLVEKHFTLDREAPGPDHQASIEPDELQALIRGIHRVASALGDGVKRPSPSERANRRLVRRSLAASAPLSPGTTLEPELLIAVRPATGISPTHLHELVGRKVRTAVDAGELLCWENIR